MNKTALKLYHSAWTLFGPPSSAGSRPEAAFQAEESSPFCLSSAFALALVVFCAIVPYLNTLANAFVYDDETQVLDNPYILSFSHLRAIFTSGVWSYAGVQGATNYYRPVMTLGYLLCFKLFGATAWGFHLANLLLHAAVACLLFVLTEKLFRKRDVALLAAAAFALHPIHTEAVAWIASVTELEVAFFFLLAFWLYLAVPSLSGRRYAVVYAGMAGSFVLALLSKEQALMLPAVATVYEHFYREDRAQTGFRAKLARYGALWLLLGAYLVFRVRSLGTFAPVLHYSGLTRFQVALSAVALAGKYLEKLLWPVHLKLFYEFHKSASPLDPGFLWGMAGGVVCLGLFALLWRRARRISFGLVWLFATLLPVLNAHWLAVNAFSERYLYLPSVGFCWLLAWGFLLLWKSAAGKSPAWRKALAGGLALVAVLSAARIVTRNRVWRDDLTLYSTALAASPGAYPIRLNLGAVYFNRGEVKQAEQQWLAALESAPDNPTLWNDLGLAYQAERRYSEAVAMFRKALALRHDYADPHLNLGVLYERLEMLSEAENEMRAAVVLAPLNLHAHNRLGSLYLGEVRLAQAETEFAASLAIAPNVVAYDGLGEVNLLRGAPGPAARAFEQALSLNPDGVMARLKLGALYAGQGRKAEAIAQYSAVLKIQPDNALARAALERLNSSDFHAHPAHP